MPWTKQQVNEMKGIKCNECKHWCDWNHPTPTKGISWRSSKNTRSRWQRHKHCPSWFLLLLLLSSSLFSAATTHWHMMRWCCASSTCHEKQRWSSISMEAGNTELSLLVLLDLTVDHHILLNVLENRFCIEDSKTLLWIGSALTLLAIPSHLFSVIRLLKPIRSTVRYRRDPSSVRWASLLTRTDGISGVVERQHGVSLHQYADDKQLFASARLDRIADLRRQLSDCVVSVKNWCASRRLQLNTDKTEGICFRVPYFH